MPDTKNKKNSNLQIIFKSFILTLLSISIVAIGFFGAALIFGR